VRHVAAVVKIQMVVRYAKVHKVRWSRSLGNFDLLDERTGKS
jgi:hypothetical protein